MSNLNLYLTPVTDSDEILLENGEKAGHPMNYTDYEGKIVERFSVALNGWPCKCPVSNPNKLGGRMELSKLLHALQAKCCKWSRLSEEELKERKLVNIERHESGELIYKPRRKTGGEKNKARTSAFTSAETIDSDDGSDDDSQDASSMEHDIEMSATGA